jgi:hypothetical protein
MAVAGFLMQSSLPTCNTILAALVNLHRRLQARRISAEAQIAKNVTLQELIEIDGYGRGERAVRITRGL